MSLRIKVYILCLLIVSAAHQSGSPLSCDEDVTVNLLGILEENLSEGSKGGGGRGRMDGGRVIMF